MRYPLAVVVVALVSIGCIGPQTRARPPARQTTAELILKAAATISNEHISAVEERFLVREVARALYRDAGVASRDADNGGDSKDLIEAALTRHHELRPDGGETWRLSIAMAAMTAALGDESRVVDEVETRREIVIRPEDADYSVGLLIESGEPFPRIVRPLPGSAAVKAGAEAGLDLRSINDYSTAGLPLTEVALLLRGPQDSKVQLGVGRRDEPLRTLEMRREPAIDRVDCRILAGDVLYLRARALNGSTAEEVRAFASTPGIPSRRVILDLRENIGGLLDASRELADAFLQGGTILSIVGRNPRFAEKYQAHPGTSSLELARVAVVVDERTGSGAEAVTAALQDNRRATIVGTATAAMARIEVLHEYGGVLIRFPVAALHRPNGTAIDGQGVQPDVVVDSTSAPAPVIADVACPAFASPGPVSQDRVVARAVEILVMSR